MNKGKYIVAGLAVAIIGVGGYLTYRYYSQKAATANNNANNLGTVDNIGKLLGDLKTSGGISGIFGSIF